MNRQSIFGIVAGFLIVAGVAVFILLLVNGTNQEAEVYVIDTVIEITGQFGVTYQIADVKEVRLENTIPKIGRR